MQKIWKYPLAITDVQRLSMPERAEILSVADQDGTLCLWAMVDTHALREEVRTIEIIGTGNPISTPTGYARLFIGTAVMRPFVWHVFERLHD